VSAREVFLLCVFLWAGLIFLHIRFRFVEAEPARFGIFLYVSLRANKGKKKREKVYTDWISNEEFVQGIVYMKS
jgi:hypothetical protein